MPYFQNPQIASTYPQQGGSLIQGAVAPISNAYSSVMSNPIMQKMNQLLSTMNSILQTSGNAIAGQATGMLTNSLPTANQVIYNWQAQPGQFNASRVVPIAPTASVLTTGYAALKGTGGISGYNQVQAMFAPNRAMRFAGSAAGYQTSWWLGSLLGGMALGPIGATIGGLAASLGLGDAFTKGGEWIANQIAPIDKAYQMGILETLGAPRNRINTPTSLYSDLHPNLNLQRSWQDYKSIMSVANWNKYYNKYDSKLLFTKFTSDGLLNLTGATTDISAYDAKFKDLLHTTKVVQDTLKLNIKDALDLMKQFNQSGFSTTYMRQLSTYSKAVGAETGLSSAFVATEGAQWGRTGMQTNYGSEFYSKLGMFSLGAIGMGYTNLSGQQRQIVNQYGGRQQIAQGVTNVIMQAANSPTMTNYLVGLANGSNGGIITTAATGSMNMLMQGTTDSLSQQQYIQDLIHNKKIQNIDILLGIKKIATDRYNIYRSMGLSKEVAKNKVAESFGITNIAQRDMFFNSLSNENLQYQMQVESKSLVPAAIGFSGSHRIDFYSNATGDFKEKAYLATFGGHFGEWAGQTAHQLVKPIVQPFQELGSEIQNQFLGFSQWLGHKAKDRGIEKYGSSGDNATFAKQHYDQTAMEMYKQNPEKAKRGANMKGVISNVNNMLTAFMIKLGAKIGNPTAIKTYDEAVTVWRQLTELGAFDSKGNINPDVGSDAWLQAIQKDSTKFGIFKSIMSKWGNYFGTPIYIKGNDIIKDSSNMLTAAQKAELSTALELSTGKKEKELLDKIQNARVLDNSATTKLNQNITQHIAGSVLGASATIEAISDQTIKQAESKKAAVISAMQNYMRTGTNINVKAKISDYISTLQNLDINAGNARLVNTQLQKLQTDLSSNAANITTSTLSADFHPIEELKNINANYKKVANSMENTELFSGTSTGINGTNKDITNKLENCITDQGQNSYIRVKIVEGKT